MGLQKLISTFIPQGVYVITSHANDKINGMTAAWVSQVSFKPRLLGVAIAPQRYTFELIQASKTFGINVLAEGQVDLAKHFGFKSGRKVNKFENVPYKLSKRGNPILLEAIAYFDCEVVSSFETGDHYVFVGEVVDYEILKEGEKPLIFRWDDYFGGAEG